MISYLKWVYKSKLELIGIQSVFLFEEIKLIYKLQFEKDVLESKRVFVSPEQQ